MQQEPRGDLLRLVRSLRAYVEELEACGSWGLPHPVAAGELPSGADARLPSRAPAASGHSPRSTPPRQAAQPPRDALAHPAFDEVPPLPEREAPPSREALTIGVKPVVHLPQAASARLEALAKEASTCTRCGLHEARRQTVFARGSGASGLVFVGEGPGEEEDRQGLPFVGPAGQLLDRMIAAMQLGRDDVYVCNIVKCRPPKNRKPEPEEMASCTPFLAEQLSLLEPRVIVALGATAVQGLLGTTEGITRLRGQWKLYRGKIPVMPTFHPAYLLRTPNAKRDVWKDLQEVLRRLNDSAPPPSADG